MNHPEEVKAIMERRVGHTPRAERIANLKFFYKQTKVVTDLIESVDNRCAAADGAVTATVDEILDSELLTMKKALKAISMRHWQVYEKDGGV